MLLCGGSLHRDMVSTRHAKASHGRSRDRRFSTRSEELRALNDSEAPCCEKDKINQSLPLTSGTKQSLEMCESHAGTQTSLHLKLGSPDLLFGSRWT